jgi:xanthine dehydrogenase accessory factor
MTTLTDANGLAARTQATSAPGRSPFLLAGNPRQVLRAAVEFNETAVLAVVLETEGSTYAHAGAMSLFAADRQAGWLSGGCLEPALAHAAADASKTGTLTWMEVDTRADEDLLTGSAIGCRGRLRIALLPLRTCHDLRRAFDTWLAGGCALALEIGRVGDVDASVSGIAMRERLPAADLPWPSAHTAWTLTLPRVPEALLFGAGPESPILVRLLSELGWRTTLVERRPRWRHPHAPVDRLSDDTPSTFVLDDNTDVALVMHHHFELDREALEALAMSSVPFIGLLGPQRRREDLFKLLSPSNRASIATRLRSPVGLPIGGQGPEAIAVSIAAQLQAWRSNGGTT